MFLALLGAVFVHFQCLPYIRREENLMQSIMLLTLLGVCGLAMSRAANPDSRALLVMIG